MKWHSYESRNPRKSRKSRKISREISCISCISCVSWFCLCVDARRTGSGIRADKRPRTARDWTSAVEPAPGDERDRGVRGGHARSRHSRRGTRGHRPHLHLRSEEHTSELQLLAYLVCRLLLEK